jgi:hypothetical protein
MLFMRQGFGPALVAVLITALGRQAAFTLSVAGWLPCGALIGAPFARLAHAFAC